MGVQIKDILEYKEVTIDFLANKKVAFDTFNMLYQFLASIRQADGSPLLDSKGNVTSHLKGLFNRLVYFKRHGIKAVFVFDGKAPKLKEKEQENRRQRKIEADKKYREALEMGLTQDASKYAQGTSRLTGDMVTEAKELIYAFGFPIVDAPSEGEAQASEFVKRGKVFACSSQDFDSLLFGCKHLIRNLSISTRRKVTGTSQYKDIPVEYYDLEENLRTLNLSQDQLIIIAILCGTDFNPGGIKGIGPKKALKIVKEYNERWDDLFKTLDWFSYFSYPWIEVFNTIKKMPTSVFDFEFKEIDKQKIISFLSSKDFEEEQLNRSLKTIKNIKTLDKFF